MQEEKILDNVQARSVYLLPPPAFRARHLLNSSRRSKELFSSLEELRKDSAVAPHILDIRGAGLMVGVEFAAPGPASDLFKSSSAPANLASRIAKKCQEEGLFILTTSVYQVSLFFSTRRRCFLLDTDPPYHTSGDSLYPSAEHHEGGTRKRARDLP